MVIDFVVDRCHKICVYYITVFKICIVLFLLTLVGFDWLGSAANETFSRNLFYPSSKLGFVLVAFGHIVVSCEIL